MGSRGKFSEKMRIVTLKKSIEEKLEDIDVMFRIATIIDQKRVPTADEKLILNTACRIIREIYSEVSAEYEKLKSEDSKADEGLNIEKAKRHFQYAVFLETGETEPEVSKLEELSTEEIEQHINVLLKIAKQWETKTGTGKSIVSTAIRYRMKKEEILRNRSDRSANNQGTQINGKTGQSR